MAPHGPGSADLTSAAPTWQSKDPVNLLLISIDSLRLDHAHHASDSQVHTPRFASLSAGFGFSERCFSVSSATRPVHASVLTGLYPFEHGIQGQQDQQLRMDAPRLLRQCSDAGIRAGFLSEAPEIFTGLDLGQPPMRLATQAPAGVAQARRWLAEGDTSPTCLLLHYWSAHTPYGADDGKALGETAELLRQGRVDEVRRRYRSAVEEVFEHKVAPLLEGLDLGRWAVVLFGDHGESWTQDEFYHGTTVRNRVLRVPLYVHVPYSGNNAPGAAEVVSLLDVYATACGLLGLERRDRGFGQDWLGNDVSDGRRYCLAELRPGRDAGEDRLDRAHEPTHGSVALRWCVFDGRFRLHGEADRWCLEHQWSEQPVYEDVSSTAAAYLTAHENFRAHSNWQDRPLVEPADPAAEQLLRRRLQDLGYL